MYVEPRKVFKKLYFVSQTTLPESTLKLWKDAFCQRDLLQNNIEKIIGQ